VLHELLDKMIELWGSGPNADEAVRAREEYATRTGKVFEDDAELFESRTASFLEWYVVERPLPREGVAPIVVSYRHELDPARKAAMRAWATSHRSLFVIEDLADEGKLVLEDLIGGARFEVAERRRFHGVGPGDLVEARLVGWEDKVLFGRTFLYHPAGARDAILAHSKRLQAGGATRADVVDHIASLRIRAERYKHVTPERVYE